MFLPFLSKIFLALIQSWRSRNPNIFVKTDDEYLNDFTFSLTNMENFSVFLAPGIGLPFNNEMRAVHRKSSLFKIPENDVAIIPFVGGTPSGDALGTTLCNTMLSMMY
jgi:hypothetical protein